MPTILFINAGDFLSLFCHGNKMNKLLSFTAIIEREGKWYVSLCPEFDIASQGKTIEEAKKNLKQAVQLFLETASKKEINSRLHDDVLITRFNIAV